jgi:hypothetical protein
MPRGRRRYENQRGESRGAAGLTYCPLCGIEAEDSAAFQTVHLESRRHKYNYLLAAFRENRCVPCPLLFVYCVVMCVKYRRLVVVPSSPMKALQFLKTFGTACPRDVALPLRKIESLPKPLEAQWSLVRLEILQLITCVGNSCRPVWFSWWFTQYFQCRMRISSCYNMSDVGAHRYEFQYWILAPMTGTSKLCFLKPCSRSHLQTSSEKG